MLRRLNPERGSQYIKKESGSPYQQGYNAAIYGKSSLVCPYSKETELSKRHQWMLGFKRAENLAWFVSASRKGGREYA
jgi:ribosome modulation factor